MDGATIDDAPGPNRHPSHRPRGHRDPRGPGAVYSDRSGWSSVGGGSCNVGPGKSTNSSWKRAYILDFTHFRVVNAYTKGTVTTYASLRAMLTGIQQYASSGWMRVANKRGNGDYGFLLVKKSSCNGSSGWAIAPAC